MALAGLSTRDLTAREVSASLVTVQQRRTRLERRTENRLHRLTAGPSTRYHRSTHGQFTSDTAVLLRATKGGRNTPQHAQRAPTARRRLRVPNNDATSV